MILFKFYFKKYNKNMASKHFSKNKNSEIDNEINNRVKFLRNILINGSKLLRYHDPINDLPKHHYNEIINNCYLGDLYVEFLF